MATLWSTEAKAALKAGCRVKTSVYIDVETGTTPAYGANIIDVTDYAVRIGAIVRSSSVVSKNWKVPPVVITVDNSSGYFMTNFVELADGGTAHGSVENVFTERPSGEANPEDCILTVELTVTLADGTEETREIHRGLIEKISFAITKGGITAELTSQDFIVAKLKAVLDTLVDGTSDTYTMPEE